MHPPDPQLKYELRQFFIIAIPLSAAYLAEFAMFLTTKMVVGKLGYHSLAAVGIAGDLSFEVLLVLMALLSVVGVLAAQAFGAGKKEELGVAVKQGIASGHVAWRSGDDADLEHGPGVDRHAAGSEGCRTRATIPEGPGCCGVAGTVVWRVSQLRLGVIANGIDIV